MRRIIFSEMFWESQDHLESERMGSKAGQFLTKPKKITIREPLWTRKEKKRFWTVISSYIAYLLEPTSKLPEHDIEFVTLDPTSEVDLGFCQKCIKEDLWSGRYSLAVSNYITALDYFEFLDRKSVV